MGHSTPYAVLQVPNREENNHFLWLAVYVFAQYLVDFICCKESLLTCHQLVVHQVLTCRAAFQPVGLQPASTVQIIPFHVQGFSFAEFQEISASSFLQSLKSPQTAALPSSVLTFPPVRYHLQNC